MDRRIRKTQTAIKLAFMDLMANTPWDAISIKMICYQADISRSSFYSHFESKDALLNFAFLDIHKQLSIRHPKRSIDTNKRFAFIPGLLDHVSSHCEIFAIHSTSAAGVEIFGRFRKVIATLALEEIEASRLKEKLSAGEIEFLAGGIFSMLENWNQSKCTESTRNVEAQIDAIVAKVLN